MLTELAEDMLNTNKQNKPKHYIQRNDFTFADEDIDYE